MPDKQTHQVVAKKELSKSVFLLGLERKDFAFEAGQYVFVNFPCARHIREYSISSGINDPSLEFIIKEVPGGIMSKRLKDVKPGENLELEGPFGFFTLNEIFNLKSPLLFVATGSGISPFRSFVRSNPGLRYQILHGVRYGDESYRGDFNDHYILCTTRDSSGDFHGRVTDWQVEHPLSKDHWCYLSGNYNMIEEMTDILIRQGIPYDHILSETHN
jgi:ferredoxin--NADP+ reductase